MTTHPTLGILVLDTGFPRIFGDVGNSHTWPFPVEFEIVSGATPTAVTGPNVGLLLEQFHSAANKLVGRGAVGITTTCGFLAALQPQLSQLLSVPFAASSLLQIPSIQALLPASQRVGIITFSEELLTASHLAGAGVPANTPMAGLDKNCLFYRMIIEGDEEIDVAQAEHDVVATGVRLVQQNPNIGAIVVECANMPPYSTALHQRLGLPIFDPVGFIHWFYSGLRPKSFITD